MALIFNHSQRIDFFDTYEAREQAFNRAVAELVPVRYQGPRVFWRNFQQIVRSPAPAPGGLPAFITSNPRDCLAFGSTAQVLAAAQMTVGRAGPWQQDCAQGAVVSFDLANIVDQSIRTLSGGETVRVALAKAMIMAAGCDQLVVSSPFCWMSANHLPHLERVVEHFEKAGKAVHILAMSEETSTAPVSLDVLRHLAAGQLPFSLTCRGLRIYLETHFNTLASRPAAALVRDTHLDLHSPCLLVGDNGQGKSLLAKALCGAAAVQGLATVSGPAHRTERARLLFQDVIVQTLMRTLPVLAHDAAYADPSAAALFDEITGRYRGWLPQTQRAPAATAADVPEDSLLAVKIMLIAVRLARRPPALILDEPDWGLSRAAALALVLSVIEAAHAMGVAVMIISHKPWWRPLAADQVQVVKESVRDPGLRFVIHLRKAGADR